MYEIFKRLFIGDEMFIYPYKAGSNSVSVLKEALNAKVIKLENSKFKGSKHKVVLNWGNSTMTEEISKCQVINKPEAVAIAVNKLKFFNKVSGLVPIPDFTTDIKVAKEWILNSKPLIVRTKLTGHSGQGAYYIESVDAFDNFNHDKVKMYVKYIPKRDEYRVHVMGEEVIDVQRKAFKHNYKPKSYKIRNHSNGFMFVRGNVNPPQQLLDICVEAVNICGLDFGAVDVIWNNYRQQAYVLEINTSPGLEGKTVDTYSKNLQEFIDVVTNLNAVPLEQMWD